VFGVRAGIAVVLVIGAASMDIRNRMARKGRQRETGIIEPIPGVAAFLHNSRRLVGSAAFVSGAVRTLSRWSRQRKPAWRSAISHLKHDFI